MTNNVANASLSFNRNARRHEAMNIAIHCANRYTELFISKISITQSLAAQQLNNLKQSFCFLIAPLMQCFARLRCTDFFINEIIM